MTHDEVIAWIDDKLAILTEIENTTLVMPMEVIARASLLANRDVLVRHQASRITDWCMESCMDYDEFDQFRPVAFPCPTYLDIASKLDEVM